MIANTVAAFRITRTSPSLSIASTCAPSPLRAAFPLSLVGRDSHDYYEHSVTVGLRGRPPGAVPVRNNLVVPGDPLSNRTGPFPSIRLSSDYCVSVAVGCPSWIAVWQAAQTTNVFLRFLAIS